MMTKSELESTNLFKTLKILESDGYRPEGLCAQISLQMLAGESPVMVKPESHVAYTQC